MDYRNEELMSRLAAEYVLGTLHGRARIRFEKLLEQDARIAEQVNYWEQRLGVLAERVKPVKPNTRVWQKIKARLGILETEQKGLLGRIWGSLGFWRGLGAAASTAAIVLAVYISSVAPTIIVKQYVAVITNSNQQASWLAQADLSNNTMTVRVLNQQSLPADKAYELWMLPGEGAPVSMGLVSPDQDGVIVLRQEVVQVFDSAQGMAVSLEPSGGSPTGAPTGPVLYQGPIYSF